MSDLAAELASFLARVPFLADPSRLRIERLAGLTNVNYLVSVVDAAPVGGETDAEASVETEVEAEAGVEVEVRAGVGDEVEVEVGVDVGQYVLRVPGAGTSEYIDRRTEEVAARAAAAAGVNADVLFFDAADGLMVTRFVAGAVTMSPDRFVSLEAVGRAGLALHSLHTATASFATDFALFEMIDDYKLLLASKGATLPDGYDELQARADETRAALEATVRPFVPSHCDPLCENFLDTGVRMFVIDYEYAGNNDPMWDLGDLSVEGCFGPDQDAALLRAYFGGDPPAFEVARMVAYKAMCDLLWTLWGVLQYVNGNQAEDFRAYATGRFERCRILMSTPKYSEHLVAILAGP